MSWIEDKAGEAWDRIRPGSAPVPQVEIERAIREAIKHCAEVAHDGEEGCGCESAILELLK